MYSTCSFKLIHTWGNLAKPVHLLECFWEVGGNWRTWTQVDIRRRYTETQHRQKPKLRTKLGPWSYDAATRPIAISLIIRSDQKLFHTCLRTKCNSINLHVYTCTVHTHFNVYFLSFSLFSLFFSLGFLP